MSGRRILITGASKGIGRAVADRLAASGDIPVGLARSGPDDFPGEFFEVDLTDRVATAEALERVLAAGRIDGVVNNVALARFGRIGSIDLDDLFATYDLNVRAAVQVVQAVLPGMQEAGWGRIVNISSLTTLGVAERTPYAASKAALEACTRIWAGELAKTGITVNAVAPGPIETEMYRERSPIGSERENRLLQTIPQRRVGAPREIAHTICSLLHEDAGYITGQIVRADGGREYRRVTSAASSTGRLGDPSAVRSLQVDDVVATYVVDGVLMMRAAAFFPAVPGDYWTSGASQPLAADGRMPMSAGGLLVERDGTTLLIDTGVGPAAVDFAIADIDCGALIDVLGAIGRRRGDVDVVAFTHLHFDHAGYAFANGQKVFPNARYVLARQEWAPYACGTYRRDPTTPEHVIRQLASNDSVLELIDDGDEVMPGVRAMVTPGHSPGHTSYVITSRTGRRLVAFGDAFHTPSQLAHPEWLSIADTDTVGVAAARRRLLTELSEPNTLGFGFHFGDQAFGRVVTGSVAETIWEPVPTSVLAPPPWPSR